MNEKGNFLRMLDGEAPAWVPRYGLGLPINDPYAPYTMALTTIGPSCMGGERAGGFGPGKDIYGVEFVATEDTGGMCLPKPNDFILPDVTKWGDYIKNPDFSNIDWEVMCKQDFEVFEGVLGLDRSKSAVEVMAPAGVFMNLMNFMGFTEGLVALYEEPEAVHELFDYMTTFMEDVSRKIIQYYKPDLWLIGDDTCTRENPFISRKTYVEMIKPYHARIAQVAIDAGIPIGMHCCGRCEDFIDEWFDFNVQIWSPAEVTNDLAAIKAKYGNKLIINGAFDSSGPPSIPAVATEEIVKAHVRDTMDAYAPGGGYVMWADVVGADNEEFGNIRRWLSEEYYAYREVPYK